MSRGGFKIQESEGRHRSATRILLTRIVPRAASMIKIERGAPEPNDDGRGKQRRIMHVLLSDPHDTEDKHVEELDHSYK